jgi:hypothetical protein
MLYNGPESEVYQFAEQLKAIFEAGYDKIVFEEGSVEDEEAKPPQPPSHHKKPPKPEDPYKCLARLPSTHAIAMIRWRKHALLTCASARNNRTIFFFDSCADPKPQTPNPKP